MAKNPHQNARDLFFQTELSAVEIAKIVGASERTCYRWIKEGQWKKIKFAARHTPALVAEGFHVQLVQMHENIMSRPPGQRFATYEESQIMSKLVLSASRMKVQVTQFNSIQIVQNLLGMVNSHDHDLAVRLLPLADKYLMGSSDGIYHPYDIEFETEDDDEEDVTLEQTNVQDTNDTPPSHSEVEEQTKEAATDTNCQKLPPPPDTDNNTDPAPVEAPQPPAAPVTPQDTDKNKDGVLLPNGLTWLGFGWVFDPAIGRKREIKLGEVDELIRSGFDVKKLKGW